MSKNKNPDFETLIKITHCLNMIEKYLMRVYKIEKTLKIDSQLSDGLVFKFIQLRQEFGFLSKKVLERNELLRDEYKKLIGLRNIAAHTYPGANNSIIQKVLEINLVLIKEQVMFELSKFNISNLELNEILSPVDWVKICNIFYNINNYREEKYVKNFKNRCRI